MKTTTVWAARLTRFYRHALWEDGSQAQSSWWRQALMAVARRVVLAIRAFFGERMHYRASALTYATLFSAVPLLSVVVAIAKGFGLNGLIEERIHHAFEAQPEVANVLIGFTNSYLSHTQGGVFLGFGLLLLLWTLVSLTQTIETTFNQIWQVKRERSTFRKVTDYTAVFFLLPILLVVTSGFSIFVTSFIQKLPDVLLLRPMLLTSLQLLPYVLMCLLFTAAFAFMPNTKVSLKSAFVAAVPSGIAFQALQFFYIHSQIWLSSYNAIYGSFAALPLFMLWCQISWYICLLGATLSYVDQNIDNFYYGQNHAHISRRLHDFLCLVLTGCICRRFSTHHAPYTLQELATEQRIPIRLVTDLLYELCQLGILVEVAIDEKGDRSVYMPACSPELLTVDYILNAIDAAGEENTRRDSRTLGNMWKDFGDERRRMFEQRYEGLPLEAFAKGENQEAAPETEADKA